MVDYKFEAHCSRVITDSYLLNNQGGRKKWNRHL
jgi:hypothetical protein